MDIDAEIAKNRAFRERATPMLEAWEKHQSGEQKFNASLKDEFGSHAPTEGDGKVPEGEAGAGATGAQAAFAVTGLGPNPDLPGEPDGDHNRELVLGAETNKRKQPPPEDESKPLKPGPQDK